MRTWKLLAGAALCCAAVMPHAQVQAKVQDEVSERDRLARAFGAREHVQQISLSPDGTRVAIIQPLSGRGSVLRIGDFKSGGGPRAILSASGDPDRLRSCFWSTDTRLVCSIYLIDSSGTLLGFSRLVALDADGKNLKVISARTSDRALGIMQDGGSVIDQLAEAKGGSLLVTRQFVPEQTTGTMMAQRASGLGVELIDSTTLRRRTVETARDTAVEYITDGHGSIRVLGQQPSSGSYAGDRVVYTYRAAGDRNWKPLSEYAIAAGTGFNPYAVDRDLNVAYGFEKTRGRNALWRVHLDGSGRRELVFARPDVDVDGLIRIGRQRRVVGVSYATERRQVEFFDPKLRALSAALLRALPKQPTIAFVDADAGENNLLLIASSDNHPGTYYRYNTASKALQEVLPVRPELAAVPLATVRPIRYRAADGTMIPGYLTLPAGSDGKRLPAIVLPHGGPGARDEWGFDWLPQYFAARGYAVLQPNFRGSSGYGDAWFKDNGFRSWRTAVGDVNDAGRWLTSEGIAAPGKLAILGWSYGGYAALQSAVLDPDLFKAVVAIAPVTDLEKLRQERVNYSDYKLVDAFIGRGPHVREGSPAQNAGRIKAPLLMFHGTLDQNVGVGASRLMQDRLRAAGKSVDYVEFAGLDHYLEDDAARTRLLSQADAFIAKATGGE